MKEESQKTSIHQNIFSKKFRNFCKKEFSQTMENLEKQRLLILHIIKILVVICILILIASFAVHYILFQDVSALPIHNIVFALVIIITICTICSSVYKLKAKKLVLNKLLSFAGDFNIVEIDKYKEIQEIKELKLFNYFNSWHFDDCINGIYNDLKIEIREIKLKRVKRTSKKTYVTPVFYGLYLKVPSVKKFDSYTIIKPEQEYCSYGEKIQLEDVEFEKMFNVKGDNQIESRYLITTAFMNRLVKLKKRELIENISISFENGFIHIGVHSSKDYFEMSLFKSAKDISTYRKIILDLITVLSVIDTLKLEQNIGL